MNSKRRTKPRRNLWTLARLTQSCRSAPIIWLALEEMSSERGSVLITPTRAELSKLSGIGNASEGFLKGISNALSALEKADWIDRSHKFVCNRKAPATLLKIILRKGRIESRTVKRKGAKHSLRKGRLESATEVSLVGDSISTKGKGSVTTRNSSKEEGRQKRRLPHSAGDASERPQNKKPKLIQGPHDPEAFRKLREKTAARVCALRVKKRGSKST